MCQNGNTQILSAWSQFRFALACWAQPGVYVDCRAYAVGRPLPAAAKIRASQFEPAAAINPPSLLALSIFRVPRLLCQTGFKPGRDLVRRDCPSRQMGIDGAGGDDQSAIEFRSREIAGFRFGFKRLG